MSLFIKIIFQNQFFIAVLLGLSLLACNSSSDDTIIVEPGVTDNGLEPAQPNTVRFIAVGDAGTGQASQYRVANAMRNKCELDGCDFVLLLGDNIYENGVESMSDAQFQTKFEQPFKYIDAPFYVVTGNHDYGGHGIGFVYDIEKALYQVDYAGISPNSKWRMPGRYYQFSDQNITFFGLDTTAQMYGDDDLQRQEVAQWINDAQSEWKIAFGHHPYKSNGPHGNAGSYTNCRISYHYEVTIFKALPKIYGAVRLIYICRVMTITANGWMLIVLEQR